MSALTRLLAALHRRNYSFVTPTPATHARVIARPGKQIARDLRDVFGWSLPFAADAIEADLLSILRDGEMLEQRGAHLRSLVRVSSLEDDLFAHSAFPTAQHDSVFFGPDSYRFARFLHQALPALSPRMHLVDVGAGTGVGAVTAAHVLNLRRVTLTDINPAALDFARANWAHAGLGAADFIACDTLAGVTEEIDLIIANPPYIADPAHRAYRDGGGLHGGAVSVRWAADAARRLKPGGALVLYTGAAVMGGEHQIKAPLLEALSDFDVQFGELDPDVFGEELEREDYAEVERIAVIGVVAVKR